jgi:hypothetical protein
MESLEKTIDFLRKDVQYLIDKKKNTTSTEAIQKIEYEKKAKIDKIKQLSLQLKELHDKKLQEKEIRNVTNKVDSLNFAAAHKKNTQEAMNKAKKLKEIRSESRQQYAIYTDYEKRYLELDPSDVPGIIFLHDSVVKEYGVCPDILFDVQEETTEIVRNKRLEWLESQKDKGEVYFKLYEKVIKEIELKTLYEEKEKLESEFDTELQNVLTESQQDILNKSFEIVKEYTECNIKTKRLKEKFKGLIHNLSILYNETGIPIHEFWSYKYKCIIVVNELQQKDQPSQKVAEIMFRDGIINKYKKLLDDINNKVKYNTNTKRNLMNELYLSYTNKKSQLKKQETIIQTGKYFRRWAVLTEAERNERFYSFADYYIRKTVTEKSDEEKCDLVDKFSKLLIESYKDKRLIYRDFVWNTSKGFIEHIKVLEKNPEDDSIVLSSKAGKEYTPKRVSVRTAITKENEKIINEEILYYIVTKVQDTLTKSDKEECTEKIKDKLRIKKFNTKDKVEIEEKIKEIYDIVQSNKA